MKSKQFFIKNGVFKLPSNVLDAYDAILNVRKYPMTQFLNTYAFGNQCCSNVNKMAFFVIQYAEYASSKTEFILSEAFH